MCKSSRMNDETIEDAPIVTGEDQVAEGGSGSGSGGGEGNDFVKIQIDPKRHQISSVGLAQLPCHQEQLTIDKPSHHEQLTIDKPLFQIALGCFTISMTAIFFGTHGPHYIFLCLSSGAALFHMVLSVGENYKAIKSLHDGALLCTLLASVIAALVAVFYQ